MPQPRDEVIYIPPPPPAAHAHAIDLDGLHGFAPRQTRGQYREVHSGVDRELQGAPQPAVYFHEYPSSRTSAAFELDHRCSMPGEVREQALRRAEQVRRKGNALAVGADAAGGGLLTQPPMRER